MREIFKIVQTSEEMFRIEKKFIINKFIHIGRWVVYLSWLTKDEAETKTQLLWEEEVKIRKEYKNRFRSKVIKVYK